MDRQTLSMVIDLCDQTDNALLGLRAVRLMAVASREMTCSADPMCWAIDHVLGELQAVHDLQKQMHEIGFEQAKLNPVE